MLPSANASSDSVTVNTAALGGSHHIQGPATARTPDEQNVQSAHGFATAKRANCHRPAADRSAGHYLGQLIAERVGTDNPDHKRTLGALEHLRRPFDVTGELVEERRLHFVLGGLQVGLGQQRAQSPLATMNVSRTPRKARRPRAAALRAIASSSSNAACDLEEDDLAESGSVIGSVNSACRRRTGFRR